MGVPSVTSPVTVEDYLSNSAYEHFEYVDGHLVELNVGAKPHARIQSKCSRKLGWLILPEERSVLVFAPGARVRTAVAGETLDGGELLPDLRVAVDELFT